MGFNSEFWVEVGRVGDGTPQYGQLLLLLAGRDPAVARWRDVVPALP